jgi:predicted Zn finger-like uncharacterized protein
MIVACPSCSARFQYEDARFQGAKSKRFRCPKCNMVFEVMNPAWTEAQPAAAAPPPPPAYDPLPAKPTETTSRKRRDAALAQEGLDLPGLPEGMRYSLAFLTGPQASTVRVLSSAVTVIGREEGDVIINDPETSRRHARIEIHADGTAWINDLGSTNGTYTNGSAIEGPTRLEDRQEFSCGRSTFMLLIRSTEPTGLD